MSYIKVDIKPKSINQLRKENPDLFYELSWYDKEKFATTKPKAETLYICPQVNGSPDKTWDEQQVGNGGPNLTVPTANQLIQCLIAHYEETGERLLGATYSRTNDVDSDGSRVYVGDFDADGLVVSYCWDDFRYSGLGLASSRKSPGTSSIESLEPVDPVELSVVINGVTYVPKREE